MPHTSGLWLLQSPSVSAKLHSTCLYEFICKLMCVCMYIYVNTQVLYYACTYYMQKYMHTHTQKTHRYIHKCVYIYLRMYAKVWEYMYMWIFFYTYKCPCMCLYVRLTASSTSEKDSTTQVYSCQYIIFTCMYKYTCEYFYVHTYMYKYI